MLQIITGKFFTSNALYEFDAKGVLYSNLYCPIIETPVGILEPLDCSEDITQYVFNYKNQIEKGNGLLIRTGDTEILEQFKLLASFSLEGYFSEYREQVVKICSPTIKNKSNFFSASNFIPSFVELHKVADCVETNKFVSLLSKILELDRISYKKILSVIRNLYNSIEVLEYNIDLAYSMLVYCLETLSQKFTLYQTRWDDLDDNIKQKLNTIFLELPQDKVDAIKDVLVEDKSVKLQQGFIWFIINNLSEEFFLSNHVQGNDLRKSHLYRVLKNAYLMRSKFVHELTPIQHQLRFPQITQGYVFNYLNEPYLTYRGFFEITKNVIENVIKKLPSEKNEEYNWREDLPGIIQLELSPRYWISDPNGFEQKKANKYLKALFSQIESGEAITNLDRLMNIIEVTANKNSNSVTQSTILLYWLYNQIIPKSYQRKDWQLFLKPFTNKLVNLSIANLAVRVILGVNFENDLHEIISEYEKYDGNRFWKNEINLPPIVEASILCRIANIAKASSMKGIYNLYVSKAIYEIPGEQEIQTYLIKCKSSYRKVNEMKLIFWKRNLNKKKNK